MIGNDLLLDERIMSWVFFPIIIMTFLISTARFYYNLYNSYSQTKKVIKTKSQWQNYVDEQTNSKCEQLIQKSLIITTDAFNTRRTFLCCDKGYLFRKGQREAADASANMVQTQSNMMSGMKGMMVMMGTMILSMGCINYLFSGIVLAKVPFSLPQKFRTMTQSGINLELLDAHYISSVSFYFLILFGLGQLQTLLLTDDSQSSEINNAMIKSGMGVGANDPMSTPKKSPGMMGPGMMGPGMMGQGMMGQQKPPQQKDVFKKQIQALEIIEHQFVLDKCPKMALKKLNQLIQQ